MSRDDQRQFVSRGGLKLAAALEAFGLDAAGWTCADLGCNVGGFTDCLLQCGAARVFAVDTGYGTLAWKLRTNPRTIVLERANALHLDPPQTGIDLVTVDLGWTRQQRAIPAALRWQPRRIITLIKPQYECDSALKSRGGVLDDTLAYAVAGKVLRSFDALGVRLISHHLSPIRGGGGRGRAGNLEFLALLLPAAVTVPREIP